MYDKGVDKCTPRMTVEDNQKNSCFNKKCSEAKTRKEMAWETWRKEGEIILPFGTTLLQMDVQLCQRSDERNITDKYKDDKPNLFTRYINDKAKDTTKCYRWKE